MAFVAFNNEKDWHGSPTSTRARCAPATDELTAAGHQAVAVTCDVADEDQVAPELDACGTPTTRAQLPGSASLTP